MPIRKRTKGGEKRNETAFPSSVQQLKPNKELPASLNDKLKLLELTLKDIQEYLFYTPSIAALYDSNLNLKLVTESWREYFPAKNFIKGVNHYELYPDVEETNPGTKERLKKVIETGVEHIGAETYETEIEEIKNGVPVKKKVIRRFAYILRPTTEVDENFNPTGKYGILMQIYDEKHFALFDKVKNKVDKQ